MVGSSISIVLDHGVFLNEKLFNVAWPILFYMGVKLNIYSELELIWYICIALQKFFLLKFKFLDWSILNFSFITHIKDRLLLNSRHYKRMRLLVNKIDYCITKPIGRNVNEQWDCKNLDQAINILLFGQKKKKLYLLQKGRF